MRQIKTLVIVEDEPLIALDLQEICQNAGYTVLAIAGSVAQAQRKFSDHCPDAIVTDMDLGPGGNGCDIVDVIRERCPDIKVIFVTATTNRAALGRIAAAEPDHVLSKPLLPWRLEQALHALG